MRDGTTLHASILIPKGATHAGILLTVTPYSADSMTHRADSPHLGPVINGYDTPADIVVEDGYIRVVVDVRGKYGSKGDFVMNRPLRGPLNDTPVDDATDIDDTVDWLVKHVPESNGKVGIVGISYDGYEALMGMVHPNPALKVAVPINPMVDGWRGDDWFHNGAFRQQMIPYIYGQVAGRSNDYPWWSGDRDDYQLYLKAGSAGALAKARGMDQLGFWRKLRRAPRLRRVLAGPGGGQAAGEAAAGHPHHAGAQPVGRGRHLRRHGGVSRAQGQALGQAASCSW